MLYQLARAREACKQVRQVVLVEGYMDLLAFHAQGFHRVTATLGTALTPQQARLLSRIADEVVLAYDGDEAGERAMLRALPIFLREEVPIGCIHFPEGMDPDDFLKKEGIEGFEKLLKQRRDLGEYAIRKALDTWDGSVGGKTKVLASLQPIFDAVRQPVLADEYTRMAADRLSLSENVIQRQVRHARPSYQERTRSPAGVAAPVAPLRTVDVQSPEEKIVRLMLKYPELIGEVKARGALDHFQEPRLKAIAEVILRVCLPQGGSFSASAVYDSISDPEIQELFARLLLESSEMSDPQVFMQDQIETLLRREVWQKPRDLKEALRQAEEEGDTERAREIMAQIIKLSSAKKRGAKDSSENV
ncbi:MAG: toprim domain-containing protein [Acidobacteriota bacterium]